MLSGSCDVERLTKPHIDRRMPGCGCFLNNRKSITVTLLKIVIEIIAPRRAYIQLCSPPRLSPSSSSRRPSPIPSASRWVGGRNWLTTATARRHSVNYDRCLSAHCSDTYMLSSSTTFVYRSIEGQKL